MYSDTIAAIATGPTNAGISIIRVSGDEAIEKISHIIKLKNNQDLGNVDTHTIHYGFVVDNKGLDVDEVLVLMMKAPHSYTREDVIEIDCHGGMVVTKKVLDCILSTGVRLAEPGEFTKRAFLNGRIDLSQAESVSDMISAKNEYARKASLAQLKGNTQTIIYEMRNQILHDVAFIEAALDDPEHIEIGDYATTLLHNVSDCYHKIEKLLRYAKDGRLVKEGIKTVIVGKPNAGKSSIMNYLLDENRAIVTDIAGTTRDIIEEELQLGDVTLTILDTAGIRETTNEIEQIGVQKTKDSIDIADFILYVIDSSDQLTDEDDKIFSMLQQKSGCILLNKSDLNHCISMEDISMKTEKQVILFSAKDKQGKEELSSYLNKEFEQGLFNEKEPVFLANVRQEQDLFQAKNSLLHVLDSIKKGMPEDFYTIDLMDAYQSLGNIIGESIEDDLVDKIFKEFCMGK